MSFGNPPENVFVGGLSGLRAALREARGAGKGFEESDKDRSDGTERGTPASGGDGGLLSPGVIGDSGGDEPGESDIFEVC